MAEIKVPAVVDGYKCVEDMAQAVLNYTYKGKTLKEWADRISRPKTEADRIRAMTDEELAEWLSRHLAVRQEYENNPKRTTAWLDWLKQEAE